jgi:hypothetical protein
VQYTQIEDNSTSIDKQEYNNPCPGMDYVECKIFLDNKREHDPDK